MKIRMKILAFILALSIGLPAVAAQAAPHEWTAKPLTVHVDGRFIPSDVNAMIVKNRTLLPLRACSEALNATVSWDQGTQTATLKKGNREVKFQMNQKQYWLNGKAQPLEVAPLNTQNRLMIPLRAFAEALDTKVEWNNPLRDVSILTGGALEKVPAYPEGMPNELKWVFDKYYVAPDSQDDFVGTWITAQDFKDLNFKSYEIRFISKLYDRYHVISVMASSPLTSYNWGIPIFKDIEPLHNHELSVKINQGMLYYAGPKRQFDARGQYDFVMKDQQLVAIRSILDFGSKKDIDKINDAYTKIL